MGSKSKQKTTSSQQSNPWGPAQAPLAQGIATMQAHMANPGSNAVYGGKRVASLDDMTEDGLGLISDGVGNQSSGYHSDVLDGKYIDAGNPHLDALRKSLESSIMPSVNATFSRAGMTGGTQHQGMLSRSMADAMAPHLFSNYENERGRQMQSASALPQIEQANIDNLMRGGAVRSGQEQAEIDADRQLFEESRTANLRGLMDIFPMLQATAGMGGSSSGTSSTTQSSNPGLLNSIIGGGMMGASLLSGGGLGAGLSGLISGGLSGMRQGAAGMHNPSFWTPSTTRYA